MSEQVRILHSQAARSRSRTMDYIELTKPELTFMSVLTTLCGYYLASHGSLDVWRLVVTLVGTAMVGGGAGALNQLVERQFDALMKRTERRPLPSGRLVPSEAMAFGVFISSTGIALLTFVVNPLTGALAALTLLLYLFVYTPMKRVSPLATVVGGLPGAIPPMMGWSAARNSLEPGAWVLFVILFCWQMPHFLSLAWMYKKDYVRAGFKLLTVGDDSGIKTSRRVLLYSAALIPASLAATTFGLTGEVYFVGAAIFGGIFLWLGVLFARHSLVQDAGSFALANLYSRRIFFASLLYLPALMLIMSVDKV